MEKYNRKICREKLCERNKELKCLYKMAEIIEEENIDINQILTEFVNIIPSAMKHPEQTHVKLKIGKKFYKSANFVRTDMKMDYIIDTTGSPVGKLSVYLEKKEFPDNKQVFFQEGRTLVTYISERIGRVIQRYNLSEELESTKKKLEIQNQRLERKNIALSEILDYLENEKEKKQKEIQANVDLIICPLLEKIKIDPNPKPYIDILGTALGDITTTFGSKLRNDFTNFTPREIEICNLLKNGKTSKEIGNSLSLSAHTINKHRDNIRKKIGIKNKKVNLVSFLSSLN
jgi:DNA-binding CsgD family transcriptional regulator